MEVPPLKVSPSDILGGKNTVATRQGQKKRERERERVTDYIEIETHSAATSSRQESNRLLQLLCYLGLRSGKKAPS